MYLTSIQHVTVKVGPALSGRTVNTPIASLQRGKTSPTCILDRILNHLMVRLQP